MFCIYSNSYRSLFINWSLELHIQSRYYVSIVAFGEHKHHHGTCSYSIALSNNYIVEWHCYSGHLHSFWLCHHHQHTLTYEHNSKGMESQMDNNICIQRIRVSIGYDQCIEAKTIASYKCNWGAISFSLKLVHCLPHFDKSWHWFPVRNCSCFFSTLLQGFPKELRASWIINQYIYVVHSFILIEDTKLFIRWRHWSHEGLYIYAISCWQCANQQ